MEGVDGAEVWDWEDNAFRLDIDSSFATTQSLWDDFSQSETDISTLFASTPVSEIAAINSSSFTFDTRSTGQLKCKDNNFTEESPSFKRRRMLDFPTGKANLNPCDLDLEPVSKTIMRESHDYILNSQSFQIQEHTSGGSIWFMGNDDSLSSVEDATLLPAESWMLKCSTDIIEQSTEDHTNVRGSVSLMPEDPVLKRQEEAGQGVEAEISACRGTVTGRSPRKLVSKVARGVAYPFALIKPIGVEGVVTLDDINQRMMMPPSKSCASHVAIARTPPSFKRVSSFAPSRKSVVALTKIHTQGRGTITIMRTKN